MLLTSDILEVPHGFTTREGGVSGEPYDSLNLGLSTGDDPARVAINRRRVLEYFGVDRGEVCALRQVHGDSVVVARPCWFDVEGDASVTNDSALLLFVGAADCFPLLFFDPVVGAVGAAHCGWRGTCKGLAGRVVEALEREYHSRPADIRVAIGPGICGDCYQVGEEVVESFLTAGFPPEIAVPDGQQHFRLDLVAANRFVLEHFGVLSEHVECLEACTFEDPGRFFSHRRDRGLTGRHWGIVRLPADT